MIRIWSLFEGWPTSAGRSNPEALLHSVDRMRAILDRERMRSDRGNSNFALLTFTFSPPSEPSDLTTMARILGERIRATDDAGLLGPRRIGVVLPQTPAAGACKLAEDIFDLLPAQIHRPVCEVYVHPSHQGLPEVRSAREEVSATPDSRPAQPMEVLFVRAMPTWKRAMDMVGACTALVLAAPLMLAVAAAIKITSRGPIVFSQPRDAIGGRRFTMYKFRTMVADAELEKPALRRFSEQDGPAFKMAKDPRVTRLGRLLRATSIDELPQLFNVLLGDMSLVGPRPLPCDESGRCEEWQRRRLDVTPGITCIWQVHGRSRVSFSEWIRMDLRYVRSRSLFKDMQLMAQTVPAVALRRGAR